MARPVEGLPRPPYVSGLEVMPYRNEWAEAFSAVEAAAMEGLAAYREMGQPTGYEGAEGFDAFVAARGEAGLLGFAQAMVPEGWINWMGVVPDARRRGIGRVLVAEIAQAGGRRPRHAPGGDGRGGHRRPGVPGRPRASASAATAAPSMIRRAVAPESLELREERGGEVALARVAEERDDRLARALRAPRHLERRPDVRARGDPDQDPLLAAPAAAPWRRRRRRCR